MDYQSKHVILSLRGIVVGDVAEWTGTLAHPDSSQAQNDNICQKALESL
jgi:hypothetical protein